MTAKITFGENRVFVTVFDDEEKIEKILQMFE